MKSFKNIANLIRIKRMNHPEALSQTELSLKLGYKNGQFVSNIERGLCNAPLKVLKKMSTILNITPSEIKTALLQDQAETLDKFFSTDTHEKTDKVKKASESYYMKKDKYFDNSL